MKKLLALLIAASIPAFGAAPHSNVESAKALTVLVTNDGFLGDGRGSGLLLDGTHVLTCAHMAAGPDDEFFVYTYPFGKVVKARAESYNAATDLLLLRLDSPVNVERKPVFQVNVNDGDEVTVIGNAVGSMKWYVTRGIISGRERAYLMTDAQVHPGNSGGPWFNDKGEVVGLSDWGLRKYPEIAGGVSARTILATLKGWEDQKKGMAMILKLLGGGK